MCRLFMSEVICGIVLNKLVLIYLLDYMCCNSRAMQGQQQCRTSRKHASELPVLGSVCLQGLEDMKSLIGSYATCKGEMSFFGTELQKCSRQKSKQLDEDLPFSISVKQNVLLQEERKYGKSFTPLAYLLMG